MILINGNYKFQKLSSVELSTTCQFLVETKKSGITQKCSQFRSKAICYGIDLGMTNSCIAVYYNVPEWSYYENSEVLENQESGFSTPSVVCFNDNHVCVGKFALENRKNYKKIHILLRKAFYWKKFQRQSAAKKVSNNLLQDQK